MINPRFDFAQRICLRPFDFAQDPIAINTTLTGHICHIAIRLYGYTVSP